MEHKNRFFKICAIFLICVSLFGCNKKDSRVEPENDTMAKNRHVNAETVKVVATIFPLYDWAKNVVGESKNVQLELLIKNGVDLHSFQPSTSDIVKISTCDVLIYVGGESDFWVSDALKNATNKNMLVINLMQELSDSVKEEEITEGMQSEKSGLQLANHEHDEVEYDEHLWLSVKNAELAVQKIAEVLKEKDKSEAELIEENENKYLAMLNQVQHDGLQIRHSELDSESTVDSDLRQNDGKVQKTIIVCDRFPFRYMTDELGIKYYAAFVGCSAETEASFETIAFLSNKLHELYESGTDKVFVTENSDQKIAQTVIKNAGLLGKCKIVTLDSMQATTLKDAQNGKNYIDVMKENYRKILEQN